MKYRVIKLGHLKTIETKEGNDPWVSLVNEFGDYQVGLPPIGSKTDKQWLKEIKLITKGW